MAISEKEKRERKKARVKGKEREQKYIYVQEFKDDIRSLNGLKTRQSMQKLEKYR